MDDDRLVAALRAGDESQTRAQLDAAEHYGRRAGDSVPLECATRLRHQLKAP